MLWWASPGMGVGSTHRTRPSPWMEGGGLASPMRGPSTGTSTPEVSSGSCRGPRQWNGPT
eukprot:14474305-Heterocapsa_arctica.AAC.1